MKCLKTQRKKKTKYPPPQSENGSGAESRVEEALDHR